MEINCDNENIGIDDIDGIANTYELMENAEGIAGLYYLPDFLTSDEAERLRMAIDQIKLSPITSATRSRRVAHFGYEYQYNRAGTRKTRDIPTEFVELCADPINHITSELFGGQTDNYQTAKMNQMIINEYLPGQSISYHTDNVKQFGPIIACVSVGEECAINFKRINGTNKPIRKKIVVESGSLYIMSGSARYDWQHSTTNRGKSARYSITFRTVA